MEKNVVKCIVIGYKEGMKGYNILLHQGKNVQSRYGLQRSQREVQVWWFK
jgi:hypothetical protein